MTKNEIRKQLTEAYWTAQKIKERVDIQIGDVNVSVDRELFLPTCCTYVVNDGQNKFEFERVAEAVTHIYQLTRAA